MRTVPIEVSDSSFSSITVSCRECLEKSDDTAVPVAFRDSMFFLRDEFEMVPRLFALLLPPRLRRLARSWVRIVLFFRDRLEPRPEPRPEPLGLPGVRKSSFATLSAEPGLPSVRGDRDAPPSFVAQSIDGVNVNVQLAQVAWFHFRIQG